MPQVKCDVCGEDDRLHRCEPGDHGNEQGTELILICDECFEERTGFIAVCQDFCGLAVDHQGECHD